MCLQQPKQQNNQLRHNPVLVDGVIFLQSFQCLTYTLQVKQNIIIPPSILHNIYLHVHKTMQCIRAPVNTKSYTNMYMWNLGTYSSEEEKQSFSSFCSLRCAFGFPMTASCCLLLSPHHCLDSLRPPQEGKVDIYIEAFGMAISRRGFCQDPGSLLQKKQNIKTKEYYWHQKDSLVLYFLHCIKLHHQKIHKHTCSTGPLLMPFYSIDLEIDTY